MESVTWKARQSNAQELICTLCGNKFIAPPNLSCAAVCCACCGVQNPGYEKLRCIKDVPAETQALISV